MNNVDHRATSYAALTSVALLWAAHAVASEQEVLATERELLVDSCRTVEFLDGYITEVEANEDGRPDYLVDTQRLRCDGSLMMFCGTIGCVHRIWVSRAGGGYDLAMESYAYEIVFDRPGDPSFRVSTRNGVVRSRLDGLPADDDVGPSIAITANATSDGSTTAVSAPSGMPENRWGYRADPVPVAAVFGPGNVDALWVACENGAARIRYGAAWMWGPAEGMSQYVRDWEREQGIVPTFATAGEEIDLPVRIEDETYSLVATRTVPLDGALIENLMRGRYLTLHHGGSLEHELNFSLSGSGAALRSLRAACR